MSEAASRTLPADTSPRAAVGNRRIRAGVLAASGAVFLGITALTLNHASQFVWLERKWLYKEPHGFEWFVAWSAIAAAAFVAVCMAARFGRARGIPWPALRWTVPAGVAAWVWAWFAEPPAVVFDLQLALCAAAALWNVALALWAWRREPSWPRGLRGAELVALELAVCLFAAELVLRTVRASSDSMLLATAGTDLDAWLRAHRQSPDGFHLGFPVNSAGIVDVEPASIDPGAALVACLGDSFGVGVVPHHLHYTTIAERELGGVEIYNAAVVNAGPREYARLLESDVLALRPRLIVVAVFVGNDITDSERRRAGFVERWLDRDEVLIRVATRRLWALASGLAREDSPFDISTQAAYGVEESLKIMPWLANPRLEPPSLSRERFLFVEHIRTDVLLADRPRGYADFFGCMERLLALAGPIPLACLIIPDEFQVEDSLWKALLVDGIPPAADRELPQKLIGPWLQARGVPYVDLLPILRAVPPLADGSRHVYHRDDTHFNARGNAIAGRALAELLQRCGVGR